MFNVLSEVVLRTTALDVDHIFRRPARNFQINAVFILPHPEHLSHVGKGIALDVQPNQATISFLHQEEMQVALEF